MSGLQSEVLPEVVGGSPRAWFLFCSGCDGSGQGISAPPSAAVCPSLSAAAFGLNVESARRPVLPEIGLSVSVYCLGFVRV